MALKLVLATHNPGKLREVREILGDTAELVSAGELGLGDVEETGATFEENALLKAKSAADASGLPALADDSGLVVDALGGRPGVASHRYAPGDDAARRKKLLTEMSGVPRARRTARFVCAVALVLPGKAPRTARGVCEGEILEEERGSGGFGYDPLFLPQGAGGTFAELPAAEKHRLSHRGKALQIVRSWLEELPG